MKNGGLVRQISSQVYMVRSGAHVLVIERAKFVLRRAGRFLQHWLRYLTGFLSTTGAKIAVCLGQAADVDIEGWLRSHNGSDTLFAYRLFEHMLNRLGISKCVALALIALRVD